jgi:uncharacterized membrane protein YagU involved in acid resistance
MANIINNPAMMDKVTKGVVAGLVGGCIFGVQMATMNMLPMVGQLIRSESVVVGFVLHLIISAIIGGIYALVASRLPSSWLMIVGGAMVYGIIWWVLGGLIIMPLGLGMGDMILRVEDMQWMSLVGHIIFAIPMAVVYKLIA